MFVYSYTNIYIYICVYFHIYCLVYFSFVKIRLVTVHNVFMFAEWSTYF